MRAIFTASTEELRTALAQPPEGFGVEADGALCARLAEAMGLMDGVTFARSLYAIRTNHNAFVLAGFFGFRHALQYTVEKRSV